jgi:hypothetical protein
VRPARNHPPGKLLTACSRLATTRIAPMTTGATSFETLANRTDLVVYGSNALPLFCLELYLRDEDIHSIAATALTDDFNDKKCDVVHIDRPSRRAFILQGYVAQDLTKKEAPANKASDLNTAVAWLLGKDRAGLPEALAAAAAELDTALEDKSIGEIQIWYCHNLPESVNVARELDQVQKTARGLLATHYPDAEVDSVIAVEVGRSTLEGWYRSSQVSILVTAEFGLTVKGGFIEEGDKWRSFCTSVPARWLSELFKSYGTDLFSANVRDYLGSRKSDANINNNIKETARRLPRRFWAYNNGITALVTEFSVDPTGLGEQKLLIRGLSVVNGAQTTGALGSLEVPDDAQVLARFVMCSDPEVIEDVIQYNNSQNEVEPADRRSMDPVQKRLREEFQAIPEADYRGGRRGSEKDIIARPPNLLPSSTVAQAVAAFHGEPNLAYNEKRRIWISDDVYGRFFNDRTSARHIVFVYSLVRAIETAKHSLVSLGEGNRTASQDEQLTFLRQRGSIWLLVSAISNTIEIFLDRPIADRFNLHFTKNLSPKDAVAIWVPVVDSALALSGQLESALERNLENRERVAEAIRRFRGLMTALNLANKALFQSFGQSVSVSD